MSRKIFSIIFLTIFFAKMFISIAPLIAISLDAKSVHAVIMQLEIEHGTSKGEGKVKEIVKDYCQRYDSIMVAGQEQQLHLKLLLVNSSIHHQGFYPSVPTPPPNA